MFTIIIVSPKLINVDSLIGTVRLPPALMPLNGANPA